MTSITLTVASFNGAPSDGALSAHFDEMGGLIGRANTNQLVLPDPDRSISRVHAQVVFRGQRYAIVDRGSNPIMVNGRAAGDGKEVPLKDGDRITIGGYELVAKVAEGGASLATPADPFADLLGAAPARGGQGGGAGGVRGGAASLIDPLNKPVQDPFGDPLAGFGAASGPAPAPMGRGAPAPPAAAGGIPDDWNPFAPDPVAAPAQRAAPRANALGLDLGAAAPAALIPDMAQPSGGGGDSLDALFGLKPGGSGGNNADPFANSALDQPMAQPNMAANADPLKSLRSAPKASADTVADDLSDLQRPFMAPPAAAPRAPVAPAAPAAPAMAPAAAAGAGAVAAAAGPVAAAPAQRMSGAVLSWDAEPSDAHTLIRPNAPRGSTQAGPAPAQAAVAPSFAPATAPTTPPAPAPTPAAAPAPAPAPAAPASAPIAASPAPSAASPAPAPAASPASAGVPSADTQALQAAFIEGLGVDDLKFNGLTPDLMRLIGQLLRESAAGTVDLLVARASFKREMQAEVTMIDARRNNPLKFSPSAEVALQHLLAPPARGFMAAAPAMRDAYADLRAHQFGMVAGMRAALDGVLERFDPAELEGKLTERSVLHSLLPGTRKARMWEVFVEHFDRIRQEASDDFQTLFGRAFVQAYEQHLDQIERESRA